MYVKLAQTLQKMGLLDLSGLSGCQQIFIHVYSQQY